MEFALLVWAIGMLPALIGISTTITIVVGTFMFLTVLFSYMEGDEIPKLTKYWAITIIACTIAVITPTPKTAYMMVGAYATQKVAESPEAKEVGTKLLMLINQKLDEELAKSKK